MPAALERELETGTGYSSPDLSDGEGRHGRQRIRTFGLVALALVVAGCIAYAGSGTRGRHTMARGMLNDKVALQNALPPPVASTVSGALPAQSAMPGQQLTAGPAPGQPALPGQMQVAAAAVPGQPAALGQVAAAPQAQAFQTRRKIRPNENMNDGNLCDDTEEEFEKLCYTKCSILLGLPDATRISAFSCCPTSSCSDIGSIFRIQTASLLPCDGFDVSSSDGRSCPHTEGACLKDEEQFMGMCYEKCSLLAPGYPYRTAAMTCCNSESVTNCLNPFNEQTNAKLAAGGGKGDEDALTPALGHLPVVRGVTEATQQTD